VIIHSESVNDGFLTLTMFSATKIDRRFKMVLRSKSEIVDVDVDVDVINADADATVQSVGAQELVEVSPPADVRPANPATELATVASTADSVSVVPIGGAVQVHIGSAIALSLYNFKGALPTLKFGTLPRIKASQGALWEGSNSLGSSISVELISFNDSFAISPCEDKAPKNLCKFSSDGVNLNNGTGTVDSWIAHLREMGYSNASSKRYLDMVCILEDAEKDNENIGSMVTLSLSPQSVNQFERYCLNATVAKSRGEDDNAYRKMKITARTKTFDTNMFTLMTFSKN